MPPTNAYKRGLLIAMAREARPDYLLPVYMDLTNILAVVGNLQLALRHPSNTGPSSELVRKTLDLIISRVEEDGFPVHAEAMRLGANPEHDI